MSTYKVIQDVEAEDKLLGPLTLRQFIYAGICCINLYLTYFVISKGAAFMAAVFLPVAAITGFFAFPWGSDQSTEVWALAKIRFMLKPRRRIWDQSGAQELVTVTAPKQVNISYTNGLSQVEVHSRLHALADTIDSRGWAIKNANLNLYAQPALVMNEPASDRLVGPSSFPQQEATSDVQAADDILDEKNNPRAQQVDTMIAAASAAHRQKIVNNLQQPAPPPAPSAANKPANKPQNNNYWFLNQPAQSSSIPANMVTFNTQVVTPDMVEAPQQAPAAPSSEDEAQLVKELDARRATMPTTSYYGHLHTIQPLSAQTPQAQPQQAPAQPQQPAAASPVSYAPPTPAPTASATGSNIIVPGFAPSPQHMAAAIAAQGGSMADLPAAALPVPPAPTQRVQPWQPPAQTTPPPPPVTPAKQAAILQLASNDDLNVATLAREAKRADQDEVVIKLH